MDENKDSKPATKRERRWDEFSLKTAESDALRLSFAIVGQLVLLNIIKFDLDDRDWLDALETSLTEVARTIVSTGLTH